MNALNKAVVIVIYLTLIALLSCEIEDDYPNQAVSDRLGQKFAITDGSVFGLYWSSENEIVTLWPGGVTATDVNSKQVRKVSFDASGIPTVAYSQPSGRDHPG